MIRTFEAFSGYKSQTMAFKKYGIEFESIGTSEIDESAILTAAHIHYDMSIELNYPPIDKILERFIDRNISFDFKKGVNPWVKILNNGKYSEILTKRIHDLFKACILTKNFGDISRINPEQIPDFDFGSYSFPCQDISMAGKQAGLEEGSGSRSSLLWEFRKIIIAKKPKYLMMENVKNLVGKQHKPDFDRWLKELEDLGYQNYWKVINAKHCGVPQNRERVFCVSILGGGDFKFLDDFDSGIRLKDILEDDVDEKYYLSDEKTSTLLETLNANYENLPKKIGAVDPEGYSRTIRVGGHSSYDNKHNFMNIVEACRITGRNPDNPKSRESGLETVQMLEVNKNPDISNCLTTVQKDSLVKEGYRIRKLTPKECFILMGVSDQDIDKIQASGISNSQQYKLAGNSIVVNCMEFLKELKC